MVKNPPAKAGDTGDLDRADPLEAGMAPTPGFLPGESHGQRSLAGYGPLVTEPDTTEHTRHPCSCSNCTNILDDSLVTLSPCPVSLLLKWMLPERGAILEITYR